LFRKLAIFKQLLIRFFFGMIFILLQLMILWTPHILGTSNSSIMKDFRVLVTGVTSIHGWPIYQKLKSTLAPHQLFGIRPPNMRIPDENSVASVCMTDAAELLRIKNEFRPTHVIHAGGVCDLDVCELRPKYAFNLNVNGAKSILSVFAQSCYLLYISADLVFSGNMPPSQGYGEEDAPDPVSVVGKTFALAEKAIATAPRHAIVRIGLPMGDSIQGKKGAVNFIENRLKRGLPISLFHDEYRGCIACDDLADGVVALLSKEVEGIFHVAGPRAVSLYEIGERILKHGNYNPAALIKWSRIDDVNGPPRIGNVHLNSRKAEQFLGRTFKSWAL
jgi:dTDP-4-dehydrorhamnose reductase